MRPPAPGTFVCIPNKPWIPGWRVRAIAYHAYQLANTKFQSKTPHSTLCGKHCAEVSTTQQEHEVTCGNCLNVIREKLRTRFKRGFREATCKSSTP